MKRLLSITILLLLLFPGNASPISDELKEILYQEYFMLLERTKPILYVWGADDPYHGKADCSGYIDGVTGKAFRNAGLPVSRTTAFNMRMGLSGWEGKDIPLSEAQDFDLIFWTWRDKPERPHGHVGVILKGTQNKLVTHASMAAKRVVHTPLEGVLERDISAIRRLTVGEEKK